MYIINLDLTLVKFICSVHYDGCGSLIGFFFITMFLSRDSSFRAFRSPCDRLSFGLLNLILASSNLTSSRKVSRATEGWTGGSQSDLTWKG